MAEQRFKITRADFPGDMTGFDFDAKQFNATAEHFTSRVREAIMGRQSMIANEGSTAC
ncbi:MAG: hypothetical protein PF501_18525 [Salinisphaera sp.]|nr:hypothetical protein [Salinisphaera sp.]